MQLNYNKSRLRRVHNNIHEVLCCMLQGFLYHSNSSNCTSFACWGMHNMDIASCTCMARLTSFTMVAYVCACWHWFMIATIDDIPTSGGMQLLSRVSLAESIFTSKAPTKLPSAATDERMSIPRSWGLSFSACTLTEEEKSNYVRINYKAESTVLAPATNLEYRHNVVVWDQLRVHII